MGACCFALGDQSKCEDLIAAYEREVGLGSCDFSQATKFIDGYSNQAKVIEPVRVPILSHSLGLRTTKTPLLPGLPALLSFLDTGRGWSQQRLSILCALSYPGSNLSKAAYLTKVYSSNPSIIPLSSIQEIISYAIQVSLVLIPQCAHEYYKAKGRTDLDKFVTRLGQSLEQVKSDLLAKVRTGQLPPQLTLDVFQAKVVSGGLKALCSAELMRKVAHAGKEMEGGVGGKTSG